MASHVNALMLCVHLDQIHVQTAWSMQPVWDREVWFLHWCPVWLLLLCQAQKEVCSLHTLHSDLLSGV